MLSIEVLQILNQLSTDHINQKQAVAKLKQLDIVLSQEDYDVHFNTSSLCPYCNKNRRFVNFFKGYVCTVSCMNISEEDAVTEIKRLYEKYQPINEGYNYRAFSQSAKNILKF